MVVHLTLAPRGSWVYVYGRLEHWVVVIHVSSVLRMAMAPAMMPIRVGIYRVVSGYPSEQRPNPDGNASLGTRANCRTDRSADHTSHDGTDYTFVIIRAGLSGWTHRHERNRSQNPCGKGSKSSTWDH